jgi:hypothetical protein
MSILYQLFMAFPLPQNRFGSRIDADCAELNQRGQMNICPR